MQRRKRSSSTKEVAPKQKASKKEDQTALEEKKDEDTLTISTQNLICTICLEYPPTEVLQCLTGHLLCADCYEKLVRLVF